MPDHPDVESVVKWMTMRCIAAPDFEDCAEAIRAKVRKAPCDHCQAAALLTERAETIERLQMEAKSVAEGFALSSEDQAARIAEAGRLLKELAGALHYELDARYGVLDSNPHPGELLRYERDMEVVERARAWLPPPEAP